jgi:hypothetical protein
MTWDDTRADSLVRQGFPPETRGVLIERIIQALGRRGGRRERVDYVRPRDLQARLRKLEPGRYRVTCIGPRGCIAGASKVMEARSVGEVPVNVPARRARDYARTRRTPPKPKLRKRLRMTRQKLRGAVLDRSHLRKKVRRRDLQIQRDRAAHQEQVSALRAELRRSRADARSTASQRDHAFAFAESQERACQRAMREAEGLRRELAAVREAQCVAPAPQPEPPAPMPSHSPPPHEDTPRADTPPADVPKAKGDSQERPLAAEVVALHEALLAAERYAHEQAAARARERAEALRAHEALTASLRAAAAQRDAATSEAARWRGLTYVLAASGGAAALAFAMRTAPPPTPSTPPTHAPWVAAKGGPVSATATSIMSPPEGSLWEASAAAWQGGPIKLRPLDSNSPSLSSPGSGGTS